MVTLDDVRAGLAVCLDILNERKDFCRTHSCDGCPIRGTMGNSICLLNDAEARIQLAQSALISTPVANKTKYKLKMGKNWESKKKFPSREAAEKALPWLSYIMATPVQEIEVISCE